MAKEGEQMPVSRVIFNGNVIIDVSRDSVKSNTLFQNTTAHASNGVIISGSVAPTVVDNFYVDDNGILYLTEPE